MAKLKSEEYKTFEDIKQINASGFEFWFARELAKILQYEKWQNFARVIERAMLACKNSGYAVADHFIEVSKMVTIGSGAQRSKLDYKLTRYACYLIVQNGDPRKEIVALGQTYFAIQTRRAEVADTFNQLDEKISGLSPAAISNNGTNFSRRLRTMRELSPTRNTRFFKTPGIKACTAAWPSQTSMSVKD